MVIDEKQEHDPGRGLVNAEERTGIAEAVALARRGPADPAEVDAVVEWVARSRLEYQLTEHVLDGSLAVYIKDGKPAFRPRTQLATPVQ